MSHITLSPDQFRVVEQATTPVEIRDPTGRVLARILSPSDQAIIDRIERSRTAGVKRFPAADVEDRLRRLEEIRGREGMDAARMGELLQRMRDQDAG